MKERTLKLSQLLKKNPPDDEVYSGLKPLMGDKEAEKLTRELDEKREEAQASRPRDIEDQSSSEAKNVFGDDILQAKHSEKSNADKREQNKKAPVWKQHLSSGIRQVVAAAIIFGILFVVMNWGAFSQVIGWEIEKITTNAGEENIHYEFVGDRIVAQTPLETNENAVINKSHVPALDMVIAPPDTRVVIPRINKSVPILEVSSENLIRRDWDALESDMQEALRNGVIHYPGTAKPGTAGRTVITGHSSYFPWDPGRFKDVFALLHDVIVGDKIILYHKQKKYIYEVSRINIVKPQDLDVLKQTPDNQLVLLTCTPIGTNINRLVIETKLLTVES